MKFNTTAIHAGQGADPSTGATVIPIHMTTTFTQEEIGVNRGYEYSRTGNPTREALEVCLAALDQARYGLAFASGSAASSAVLSTLRPGDHVVASEDMYGGTYRQFERLYRPMGVQFSYVDGRNISEIWAAITPATRIVWLETPTNPLLQITDIPSVARITSTHGILLVVDNTFATPFLQTPLALGADVAVYSTTKYMGGHSDAVGGSIVTNRTDVYESAKFYQNAAGAVPGPFECWLTLRGLKTLGIRMERHSRNALHLAEFCRQHPNLEQVIYPGLAEHPQHALAASQMKAFGGMLSIELKGGVDAVNRFIRNLKVFSFAESLGGVESLVCHPDTMTHASIPENDRRRRGLNPGLVRLSVGIEDIEDLTKDIDIALRESGK